MTAALELTATPELRARHDVTVHQLGWRVGGKGASGRNRAKGDRIEEHGLHIWFGFYDNAFDLLRRCYVELDRAPDVPIATFEQAFTPCDEIVLGEQTDDGWELHRYEVPRNGLVPGTSGGLPTLWELVIGLVDGFIDGWDVVRSLLEDDDPPPRPGLLGLLRRAAEAVQEELEDLSAAATEHVLRAARGVARVLAGEGTVLDHAEGLLCDLLREARDLVWTLLERRGFHDDTGRAFAMNLDLVTSIVTGIIDDEVLVDGFAPLDHLEYRDWLTSHGLHDLTRERSPVLRGLYSGGFAFAGGDPADPDVAAGAGLHGTLRIATYRDSILRKMTAGMGDVVFAPMYEVLVERGVRFEFFDRVTGLELAGAGTEKLVERIRVVRQARLAAGVGRYEPLVDVDGLPCWPSEPGWDQLEPAAAGVRFERGEDAPGAVERTLHRGTDFDDVVLGIPVAALPAICGELLQDGDNPRFAEMVAASRTTMTQAYQLWTTGTAHDLGWPHAENSILTAFTPPLDTYAEMSHLIPREHWIDGRTRGIAYYCGVLADVDGETPEQIEARAAASVRAHVEQDLAVPWPRLGAGAAVDWDALVAPTGTTGPDRLTEQYVRANHQPTERYTLSPAGSIQHRLAADESGYANLVLTGDWIRTGFDLGCVEASVMAGMQASRALCGQPTRVLGEDHGWLRSRPDGGGR